MAKTFYYKKRKGQSFMEYSFLVAMVVAILIAMQVRIARGMRGQLQTSSDQLSGHGEEGGMYAYTLTTLNDHSFTATDSFEVTFGAFGPPRTRTRTSVYSSAHKHRGLERLNGQYLPD
jgi:hypothetical protein